MLASKNRFHGHGSLRYVYAKGQMARSKYFVCKSSTNYRRLEPRVAVVVSKKVIKSAVKRNRIRRRIYEAIRAELPKLTPKSDIVLIVTSAETLTVPSTQMAQSLQQCFAQSNLYKQVGN